MLYCRTLHGLRRNCMLLLVFRHDAHVKLISYTDLPGTDAELLDLGTNLFYLKRSFLLFLLI
ncbi:hypothetical protein Peur_053685 [Populus x canadensis]